MNGQGQRLTANMAFVEGFGQDMGSKGMLLLVAILSVLILRNHEVEGGRNLTREEDLELEKQLKLLNKPAIMSIETEDGDIFDCVDFYKQPAFDHPLLKNYKLQVAWVRTSGEAYYGTRLFLNTWNDLYLSEKQFSLIGTWVQNQQDSIVAGWIKGGFQNTGCFNTFCPGFIQSSEKIPLGMVLPVSKYAESMAEIQIDVSKDLSMNTWGLWWGTDELVGYWPQYFFDNLDKNASTIAWGGQAQGPPNEPKPRMGSGRSATSGYRSGCYVRQIKLMDGFYNYYDPNPKQLVVGADKCYVVYRPGNKGGDWSYNFYVGGPDC
ncbi:protein neprosin-like isoform X2 [Tasmannia lanceolata]|uniref:protein neprosin-like isoform X2 n=1 Tax=Tasmannia lanceolata TaxID=3420 RepID=UPI004063732F